MRLVNKVVQNGFLLYKDIVTISKSHCILDIVPHLTFKANIRNQSHAGFGIHTWEITGIGISIRIPIAYIKYVNEINSVFKF